MSQFSMLSCQSGEVRIDFQIFSLSSPISAFYLEESVLGFIEKQKRERREEVM